MNVPSESMFPGIYLSDIIVSQCEDLKELSKCKSGTNSVEGVAPNMLIFVLQFCLNYNVEVLNYIVSNKQFTDSKKKSLKASHIEKSEHKLVLLYDLFLGTFAFPFIDLRKFENFKTFLNRCLSLTQSKRLCLVLKNHPILACSV